MDNGARRVVPIILILIVIAVAIAAMVSIGQNIFGGGGQTQTVNQGKRSLLNTSDGRAVRMTVRGPIVANENFYSYTITASSTARNMTVYNGYLNSTIVAKDYNNNIPAYEQFVYALDGDGMMNALEPTGDRNDTRGVCPTGRLITYETLNNNTTIKTLWTTTCGSAKGTLGVQSVPMQNLFNAQIPDYLKMINGIKLG